MYFRARYYDRVTGEFTSRDPLEFVDGMSLYRAYFVPNHTDPKGKDIYVETGNDNGNPVNGLVHQSICVDTWDSCDDDKPSGKTCFSFAANGEMECHVGSNWLGHPGCYHCCVLTGHIYETTPVKGATKSEWKKTTCAQDQAWLKYIRTWKGVKGGYSVGRHNCRNFSQLEFDIAPGVEWVYVCVKRQFEWHGNSGSHVCVRWGWVQKGLEPSYSDTIGK